MKLWIDAQLSPAIAAWINETWPDLDAKSLRALGLRDARDDVVFEAARKENAVIITKDSDFINLLESKGSPPKVILLTFGNATNRRTRQLLASALPTALEMLNTENLVEISGSRNRREEDKRTI